MINREQLADDLMEEEIFEDMQNLEIEKARQLLNVLEMKAPKGKIESLIKLLCIKEFSRNQSY